MSGAIDTSFTLVEERRGSGKATLSYIGRDIESAVTAVTAIDGKCFTLRSFFQPVSEATPTEKLLHMIDSGILKKFKLKGRLGKAVTV